MAILNPYISYESAKDALDYYENVFSAKNVFRLPLTEGQAKEYNISDKNLDDTTMHGGFTVLGAQVYVSDNLFGAENNGPSNITLNIEIDNNNADEISAADRFYMLVRDSGQVTVTMPFQEQFWGGKMGAFTDKYGMKWTLHLAPQNPLRAAVEEG
ncbi:glyoxalase/bleomycin resistance/extradiol dioxygenase family protein [Floricoccus penangensis]|uniref:glyoxalase/bleomycin resistance/extradiol dioxygenase family protein n=1 Tax=Floricoccus penangensis TaxID=1859475 RepID=UPI00203C9DCB|nr:glyoxalase/bleomycin resistance/extradiol dioxygenase family protein [Floricoccus penangensis]URZ87578.1 glyoxalase/bleomycin resistance/extradiol dioxygenase family protein [Floricoccus penangensis]